jgi:hypothetical protein
MQVTLTIDDPPGPAARTRLTTCRTPCSTSRFPASPAATAPTSAPMVRPVTFSHGLVISSAYCFA